MRKLSREQTKIYQAALNHMNLAKNTIMKNPHMPVSFRKYQDLPPDDKKAVDIISNARDEIKAIIYDDYIIEND